MRLFALGFVTLAFALCNPQLRAQTSSAPITTETSAASPNVEIEALMSEFHSAVVAHDGGRVAALAVPEGSTWFNVLSDSAFAAIKAKKPDAEKVTRSSFAAFSKFVSATPAALDPEHSQVQILTDGTIAAVYFRFVFLINGKAQNQGHETWQLVKTSTGWKIAAITYSSNPS